MATFTFIHVVVSLLGIVSGFVVLSGFVTNRDKESWAQLFLSTTILTSVTGFGFPANHITPAHVVGIISLAVLAVAVYAKYAHNAVGNWRLAYVVGSSIALYFNVFVLIVQLFQKVPVLRSWAPTQSEFPFAATQLVTLVGFIVLGTLATRRFQVRMDFHPQQRRAQNNEVTRAA